MSKIPYCATPLERIIHQAFHDISEKYDLDVDLVAEIIAEYDDMMSRQIGIVPTFDVN